MGAAMNQGSEAALPLQDAGSDARHTRVGPKRLGGSIGSEIRRIILPCARDAEWSWSAGWHLPSGLLVLIRARPELRLTIRTADVTIAGLIGVGPDRRRWLYTTCSLLS